MSVDSFEILVLTLSFIVPGYLIYTVLRAAAPRGEVDQNTSLIRSVILSALHNLPWFLIIFAIDGDVFLGDGTTVQGNIRTYAIDNPWWVLIIGIVMLIISPILFGIAISKLTSSEGDDAFTRLLRTIGLNPRHSAPSSWDYVFNRLVPKELHWICVELEGGKRVAGKFAKASKVALGHNSPDLYLQEFYEVDKSSGTWTRVKTGASKPRVGGVLIRGDKILWVELYPGTSYADEQPTGEQVPEGGQQPSVDPPQELVPPKEDEENARSRPAQRSQPRASRPGGRGHISSTRRGL